MARIITPAPTWSAPSALFHKVYKESRDYALSCARVEISDKMISMGYSREAIYASLYPMQLPSSVASALALAERIGSAHWYRRDRERIAKARAESRRNAKIRRFQREYLRSIDWEAAA